MTGITRVSKESIFSDLNNPDAIIIEFKVFNPRREALLEDILHAALSRIEEKKYETALLAKGFGTDKIKMYGIPNTT